MDKEYQIVSVDKPEWEIIGSGINEYNRQQAGDDHSQSLCFVLKAPDQEIAGGVIGIIHWNWLHVYLLWVKEGLRGRGYGDRLLRLIEDEARQRGAGNVYLDTFSFQAPDFYKQRGYRVFGELRDFPAGHQRYYLTKSLD